MTWLLENIDWNEMSDVYDFALALRSNPTSEGVAKLDAHMPAWVSIEEDWSLEGNLIRAIHTVRDTIVL